MSLDDALKKGEERNKAS